MNRRKCTHLLSLMQTPEATLDSYNIDVRTPQLATGPERQKPASNVQWISADPIPECVKNSFHWLHRFSLFAAIQDLAIHEPLYTNR